MGATPSYREIPIERFRRVRRDIRFDVYLMISQGHYTHVFSRITGIDYKRLAQYRARGVASLFIREDDFAEFEQFVRQDPDSILKSPTSSTDQKVATLLNLTEQTLAEVFAQHTVLEETAEQTQEVLRGYLEMMAASPNTLALLLRLASHGDYAYYHAIATAIFGMYAAKATGKYASRSIEAIMLGGFFHDIGKVHFPKDLLERPRAWTDEERASVAEHPRLGLEMLQGASQVPDETRYIIYQHHERPDGQGYPNALSNERIYPGAKLIRVVDAFGCLLSRRSYRSALTAKQAIEQLAQDQQQFDPEIVKIVASVFARGTSAA